MNTKIKALVDKANAAHAAWTDIKDNRARHESEDKDLWRRYEQEREAIKNGTATSVEPLRILLKKMERHEDGRISYATVREAAHAYVKARDEAVMSMVEELKKETNLVYIDPFTPQTGE